MLHYWSYSRLLFQRGSNSAACGDKIGDNARVDIQIAFVFTEIAQLVALGQHAPDFGAEAERVRQDLKHDVAVLRAIARAAQSGKTKRMRGVVSQVEATFQRQVGALGVFQARETGAP